MAFDYSQYSGMKMPDIFAKAGFNSYGVAPEGWDWNAFNKATGLDSYGTDAAGRTFDPKAFGFPTGPTSAPANPIASGTPPNYAQPGVPSTNPLLAGSRFQMKSGGPGVPSTGAPTATGEPAVAPGGTSAFNPRAPVFTPGAPAPGIPPPQGSVPPQPGVFDPSSPNNFGNTSTFQLNPQLQQAFQYILQQALGRYSDPNGQQYYSGPLTPGLTPAGTAAQTSLTNFANGPGSAVLGPTTDFYNAIMGLGTNPGSNPALDQAVSAMRASANQQFTNPGGPLSVIRTAAGQAGQQGGTRQGIAEGVAAGQEATGLDSAEAQMRYQAQQDARTNALRAMGLLPTIDQAGMAPGLALSAVDSQNRDIALGQNTDAFNAWAYNTTQPDIRLSNLMSQITGALPLGGTSYNQTMYPPWYTAMLQSGGQGGSGNSALAGVTGLLGLYQLFGGGKGLTSLFGG